MSTHLPLLSIVLAWAVLGINACGTSEPDEHVDMRAPSIAGSAGGAEAGERCRFIATLEAIVTGHCPVPASQVSLALDETTGRGSLGAPVVRITQLDSTTVAVRAEVPVVGLRANPAEVRFSIRAPDICGGEAIRHLFALVGDLALAEASACHADAGARAVE